MKKNSNEINKVTRLNMRKLSQGLFVALCITSVSASYVYAQCYLRDSDSPACITTGDVYLHDFQCHARGIDCPVVWDGTVFPTKCVDASSGYYDCNNYNYTYTIGRTQHHNGILGPLGDTPYSPGPIDCARTSLSSTDCNGG